MVKTYQDRDLRDHRERLHQDFHLPHFLRHQHILASFRTNLTEVWIRSRFLCSVYLIKHYQVENRLKHENKTCKRDSYNASTLVGSACHLCAAQYGEAHCWDVAMSACKIIDSYNIKHNLWCRVMKQNEMKYNVCVLLPVFLHAWFQEFRKLFKKFALLSCFCLLKFFTVHIAGYRFQTWGHFMSSKWTCNLKQYQNKKRCD